MLNAHKLFLLEKVLRVKVNFAASLLIQNLEALFLEPPFAVLNHLSKYFLVPFEHSNSHLLLHQSAHCFEHKVLYQLCVNLSVGPNLLQKLKLGVVEHLQKHFVLDLESSDFPWLRIFDFCLMNLLFIA